MCIRDSSPRERLARRARRVVRRPRVVEIIHEPARVRSRRLGRHRRRRRRARDDADRRPTTGAAIDDRSIDRSSFAGKLDRRREVRRARAIGADRPIDRSIVDGCETPNHRECATRAPWTTCPRAFRAARCGRRDANATTRRRRGDARRRRATTRDDEETDRERVRRLARDGEGEGGARGRRDASDASGD